MTGKRSSKGAGDRTEEVRQLAQFGVSMISYGMSASQHEPEEKIAATIYRAQRAAKDMMESIDDGLARVFHLIDPEPGWPTNLRYMASLGRQVFDAVLADDPDKDDYQALEDSFHHASDDPVLAASLMLPSIQMRWNWIGRWYEQGMPRVVWSDRKFPEMLMMSNADPSVIEHVKPPWRAFLVDLPPDLLFSRHPRTGQPEPLTQLMVHCIRRRPDGQLVWNFMAQGPSMIELWRHGLTTEHLIRTGEDYYSRLYAGSVEAEDDRIFVLLGRLLIGLCLTLSDPRKVREARHTKHKSRAGTAGAKKPLPITRNFVVEAVTTLRVREALQEFVQKGPPKKQPGHSPTVRSLVRGHWKMQPHGPGRSLRKLIFREPYWSPRDESLPAVTREFVVKSDSCDPDPDPSPSTQVA